ncbi:MAG: TolC family protein [Proteobacteria bacterium]|jgi:outer membrane protein TolC|nr:TolC family protein [Pseudomonadota bacterium]
MSDRRLFTGIFAALALSGAVAAAGETAQERIVRSDRAVGLAAAHNGDLRAALLEERRASVAVTAEEGLRPFTLQLDGGYTHSSSPAVGADGDVDFRTGNQLAVGGQVSKTTAAGTQAAVRVEGASQIDNPDYGLNARLSVTQPILRGAGKEVGEASLRQAQNAEVSARLAARRTASALARDVLDAYWELWYAERALEIDARARDVAKTSLEETRIKIEQGAAAEIDALQYETHLASLEETVVAAEADVRRLSVQLATLLGLAREVLRVRPDPGESPPLAASDPPADEALRAALSDAPEIRESAAAVTAAEERARTAGEAMRQRLDLVGWIGAQTLGYQEVPPAFTQFGDGAAYAGYVGLVYELPMSDTRKDAQRASAKVDVEIARQRLVTTGDQVRAEVAIALEKCASGRKRLALAEQTLAVARRLAEAERTRYDLGVSIFIQVRDAEEAEREAQLRTVRARIDLMQAQIELDHLTGALLARLGRLPQPTIGG